MIPKSLGGIYAKWVSDMLEKTADPIKFEQAISNLRPAIDKTKFHNIGEELDAAANIKKSPLENGEPIDSKDELEELILALRLYEPLLTEKEVAYWLSIVLNKVMKFSAYDDGIAALANHQLIIHNRVIRRQIVNKIVNEIFNDLKGENLISLSDFLKQITEHAIRTNQDVLIDFCREILASALNLKEYRYGLWLWSKLVHLRWATSERLFKDALFELPQIQTKDDFIYIVNEIGCPADKKAFESLFALLIRSKALSNLLPENIKYLHALNMDKPKGYIQQIWKCFLEAKSYRWLNTQVRFGLENFTDFHELLPLLVEKAGVEATDNWLKYIVSINDDLLITLIGFSIILSQIRKGNLEPSLIDRYLGVMRGCRAENIEVAIKIPMEHWDDLSIEQLQHISNFLRLQTHKQKNIIQSMREIEIVIQHKIRIEKVRNLFGKKKAREISKQVAMEFVSDFVRSADVEAWSLFEKRLLNHGYQDSYHRHLIVILLENQYFNIESNRLIDLAVMLSNARLFYEADLIIYWLFFQSGVYINPISTIERTLGYHYVDPADAGVIIKYAHGFNKKRVKPLVNKLVHAYPHDVEKFVVKLDTFVVNHPTHSIENKLIALISDLEPKVIWVESCKSLSKLIKSELKNIQKWRN